MSKNSKIKLVVIFFIILMTFLIINKLHTKHETLNNNELKTQTIFENINKFNTAKINNFMIYGTHLNLDGNIELPKISDISIYSVHIVAKNLDGKEEPIDCTYTYKDNILTFSTTDKINKGLFLENLENTDYYLFLKVIFSNSEERYYSLENISKFTNTTYYTMSKKNKIDIKFGTFSDTKFLGLFISKIDALPNNVYDIAIDASHGGKDTGAKSKKYTEADLVLKYSQNLKQKLEEQGYKVFLSRNGSESPEQDLTDVYAENGRINTIQESHSKILISLNLNSTKSKTGGVEIYAPTRCDLKFAKSLADNIVKIAKTSYSSAKLFKQDDGVYVRNYTEYDILTFKASAILHKYEPYSITKQTPYQYMIREVGGIATNAFVDGRNTDYGKNKYFDSNIGIEAYILELGYMNIEKDLNNIVNNENLYTQAIVEAIKNYVIIN